MEFLQAAAKQPAAAQQSPDPTVQAFIALCSIKLGLQPNAELVQVPAAAATHPVQHLANALSPPASQQRGQQRTAADTRAAGEALAFLLHPSTAGLPQLLTDEAQAVLKAKSAALASSGPQAVAAGSNAGAGSQQYAAWEERAKRSEALTKLLGLTGMQPVKKDLFSLAAQVQRGGDWLGEHHRSSLLSCTALWFALR